MKIFSKIDKTAWEAPKESLYGEDIQRLLESEDIPKQLKSALKYMLSLEDAANKWQVKIDREENEWEKYAAKIEQKFGVRIGYQFRDTLA